MKAHCTKKHHCVKYLNIMGLQFLPMLTTRVHSNNLFDMPSFQLGTYYFCFIGLQHFNG